MPRLDRVLLRWSRQGATQTLRLRREGVWQLQGRNERLHSDILIPKHFQEYYEPITDHLEERRVQQQCIRIRYSLRYRFARPRQISPDVLFTTSNSALKSKQFQWIVYQPYPAEVDSEFLLRGKIYSTVGRFQESKASLIAGILGKARKDEDGRGLIVVDSNTPWWD